MVERGGGVEEGLEGGLNGGFEEWCCIVLGGGCIERVHCIERGN